MDPTGKERAMKRFLGIAAALALTACATSNPNVVPVYGAQRMSNVYDATVLSVRPITIDGSQSGLGAGAGAIAGGIAGSNVGGGNGAIVGSVIGAVIGGVAGNAVERGSTQQNGVEIIVQLRNGQRRAIVQGATPDVFAPGDPVILIVTGANTRVQRAPQVGQAPAHPAPANYPAPGSYPVPADYPDAPVQRVYPTSGAVPPRT
jgi:outer membrane lipoprotein SlyB